MAEFADYANKARASFTQIVDLLLLVADIQAEILHREVAPGARPVSERALRDHILNTLDWVEQRLRWEGLNTGLDAAPQ